MWRTHLTNSTSLSNQFTFYVQWKLCLVFPVFHSSRRTAHSHSARSSFDNCERSSSNNNNSAKILFFPPNMAFVKCGKYTKLTILHRMLGTHFELPHSHICCCCYCCCCCCMPLLVIDKINKVKLKFLYIYTFCEFRMWMLPPLRVRLDRCGDDGASEWEREKLLAHQRHKQQQQDFFLSAEEQKKRPILHFIFCSSVSSYSHTLRSYITHSHMILRGGEGRARGGTEKE